MGTEVLRPQDCLGERIRFPPARKHYGNYNYNFNPKPNRKPAVRSERKRFGYGSGSSQSSSSENLAMVKMTILRRGESLDLKKKRSEGEGLVVTGTDRLGPDPEMVQKQIRFVDLRSPVKSDVYAGSAFAVSPAPSSLPLPTFSKKKQVPFDDSATRDLRRLLRLDL